MYPRIKRALDIALSALGLVVLSPLLLLISALVKLTSRGNVLFCQKRAGRDGSFFMIYKFRTMYSDAPKNIPTQDLQNPDRYITPLGRFLRASSLDELPQLVNILRGEMSIVGPRPALYNEDELIAGRTAVGAGNLRPGLTGWAQINGRDTISLEEKLRLDAEYARRMSFSFDAMCFFATFISVFRRDGVHEGVRETSAKEGSEHAD